MARAAAHKWQVASTYRGWVQAGKKGPEKKCGVHYAGKGNLTACQNMATRGNTPARGFTHYRLHWYTVELASATGQVCRACQRVAPAAQVQDAVA